MTNAIMAYYIESNAQNVRRAARRCSSFHTICMIDLVTGCGVVSISIYIKRYENNNFLYNIRNTNLSLQHIRPYPVWTDLWSS